MIETLYDAAARAGLLVAARVGGTEVYVDFRAPDEVLLNGLAVGRDYAMTYLASRLPLLAVGDAVEIAGQTYRVREITAVGDGSEHHATLTHP